MGAVKDALRIFSTRSMRRYAASVATQLERFSAFEDYLPYDAATEGLIVTGFADGEMEVEVRPSVRGQDVYLLTSCTRNPEGIPGAECKMETYHAVDALRRAQARRVTVFEPYISAGRSDRTTRRNSVGLWVHFKTLIGLGVNHIITYNLHSDMSVSMVDPTTCFMDNIPALKLLKEHVARAYIRDQATHESVVKRDWVFCSVDAGGELLAKRFASSFGTDMVVAHKQRDYSVANTVHSTRILAGSSLEGKTAWVVDDILDTGRSVYRLIQELRTHGVRKVNIAVVHAVLSPPALQSLSELHRGGLLDTVVTTDTIPYAPGELERHGFISVVPSARLSTEVVHRLHRDASLSELFDPFRPDLYFRGEGESLGVT
jgi:ribose-phosphate pyrophosphokinase